MSWTTAIVLIVLIAVMGGVLSSRHYGDRKHSRGPGGDDAQLPSQREQQLEEELDQLRDRIAVLERIATDGNSVDARETQRIAAEIEALRDKQDNG